MMGDALDDVDHFMGDFNFNSNQSANASASQPFDFHFFFHCARSLALPFHGRINASQHHFQKRWTPTSGPRREDKGCVQSHQGPRNQTASGWTRSETSEISTPTTGTEREERTKNSSWEGEWTWAGEIGGRGTKGKRYCRTRRADRLLKLLLR